MCVGAAKLAQNWLILLGEKVRRTTPTPTLGSRCAPWCVHDPRIAMVCPKYRTSPLRPEMIGRPPDTAYADGETDGDTLDEATPLTRLIDPAAARLTLDVIAPATGMSIEASR
jgi:hypothetical protein